MKEISCRTESWDMKVLSWISSWLSGEPTWRCHQNPFIGALGIINLLSLASHKSRLNRSLHHFIEGLARGLLEYDGGLMVRTLGAGPCPSRSCLSHNKDGWCLMSLQVINSWCTRLSLWVWKQLSVISWVWTRVSVTNVWSSRIWVSSKCLEMTVRNRFISLLFGSFFMDPLKTEKPKIGPVSRCKSCRLMSVSPLVSRSFHGYNGLEEPILSCLLFLIMAVHSPAGSPDLYSNNVPLVLSSS
jgi:hypothetical protein